MDINVAILRLKPDAKLQSRLRDYDPADYEIFLADRADLGKQVLLNQEASPPLSIKDLPGSKTGGRAPRHGFKSQPSTFVSTTTKHLPRCRVTFDQEPAEVALVHSRKLFSSSGDSLAPMARWRRAVRVALCQNLPAAPSHSPEESAGRCFSAMFCVPLLDQDRHMSPIEGLNAWPLVQLKDMCQNSSGILEPETCQLILRLDQWLRENRKLQPRFLSNLFFRSRAGSRVKCCAHNPAYLDELPACWRVGMGGENDAGRRTAPTELAEEVRMANEGLTKMMALEKCDVFIMNPLFGSGLPYRVGRGHQIVTYYAKDRPEPSGENGDRGEQREGSSESTSADSTSWADEFPLHYCAYAGKHDEARQLLRRGLNPNLPDRDSWTPLHYAAWYGQLGALQALLNYGNCAVNVRNRNGSTALHFAALCGQQYVTELLLTHPDITVDAKDKDEKSPLDLCDSVPKPEWHAVSNLLKAARIQKLPKIQVDLMDGSNVMLSLVNGADTTAADLHQQMADELRLGDSCRKLFAVWVCSESLEVQLKADHKPAAQLQKWKTKILPKWSDSPNPAAEEARLVFRRDARARLADEKKAKLTDSALALLYDEAHANYLKGLYPCSDHDMVMVAALMLQIVHGNHDAKRDKQLLANELTLKTLLPQHKLKMKGSSLIQKIINEHKQVTNKGARSISGLQYQFLSFCWNLKVYGSAFFNAMLFMAKPMKGALPVHACVNDFGLHLLNQETKLLLQSYQLKALEWTYQADNPYLDFKFKSVGSIHMFTLRTRQLRTEHWLIVLYRVVLLGSSTHERALSKKASHINMLLTKLLELNGSRTPSKANLNDKN